MTDNKYFAPVKAHSFKEHPVKNYLAEEFTEFDVIGRNVGEIDFFTRGKFSDTAYCKALISKFSELSKSQVKGFIEYQLNLVVDPNRWLIDLERLVELNVEILNRFRDNLMADIQIILTEMLNNTSPKIPATSGLKWNGTDTDLLELVVALTQTKTVVNLKGESIRTELIAAFEDLFNNPIANPENTLQRAAARSKDKTPFLRKLMNAFEIWANRRK